jgi:RyR domain
MLISKLEANFEQICEDVHKAWMQEKIDQGFHAPYDCPCFDDKRASGSKYIKYCNKCHEDLYPYDELFERVKEYDRVTARAVINSIQRICGSE